MGKGQLKTILNIEIKGQKKEKEKLKDMQRY